MSVSHEFAGTLFLLCMIFLMCSYLLYICSDFFCFNEEQIEETDRDLDIIFALEFDKASGRTCKIEPLKNDK